MDSDIKRMIKYITTTILTVENEIGFILSEIDNIKLEMKVLNVVLKDADQQSEEK